jgi:hypothetical protein
MPNVVKIDLVGLCSRCYICLRPPTLLSPYTLYMYYSIFILTGMGGGGPSEQDRRLEDQ